MSQSPAPEGDRSAYDLAWRSLSQLLRRGESWSGRERHVAFLGLPDGSFANAGGVTGLDFEEDGRALARVDWDGDGDLDLFLSGRTGPRLRFLQNQLGARERAQSLGLRLEGRRANRQAIGARVRVRLAGGATLIQTLRAGEGFLAQSSSTLHFGLGGKALELVEVDWPGGGTQVFEGLQAGQTWHLVEGVAEAVALATRADQVQVQPAPLELPVPNGSARTVLAEPLPLASLPVETKDGRAAELFGIDSDGGTGIGRPLLLTLWGSFCAPCVRELKALTGAAEQLRRSGLELLALSVDESEEERARAAQLLESVEWPFSRGFASPQAVGILQAIQGVLHDSEEVFVVPTSLLLDERGQVVVAYKGRVEPEWVLRDLKLIQKTPQERLAASLPFSGYWLQAPGGSLIESVEERLRRDGLTEAAAQYQLARLEVRRFSQAGFHLELAVARARQGKAEEALEHLERALEEDPDHTEALRLLGYLHHQAERYDAAIRAYRAVLRLESGDARTRFNLGLAFLASGNLEGARGELLALERLGSELAAELRKRVDTVDKR